MIKAVIFDADGVLIKSERFSTYLKDTYGITKEQTLPFFTGIFKDCLIGKADLKEVIQPYLKEWGWKKSVDELLEEWFSFEHKINEELMSYVQDLRNNGVKCVLATNNEKYRINYMLDQMGFSNSLDKVYGSAHLGYKKPAIEFYALVMTDMSGIDKKEVVFWDDDEENVKAAQEFGINAEFYTTFKDFKNKMAYYLQKP